MKSNTFSFNKTFCELAEYLAHLRKIRQKLRRKSAQELEKLEAQLRKHNNIATNFNNNELDEQPVKLRQLHDKDRQLQNQNCGGNLRKLHRQLRAKSAQELEELHFKLSSQDRTTTNFDNELATNFDNNFEQQIDLDNIEVETNFNFLASTHLGAARQKQPALPQKVAVQLSKALLRQQLLLQEAACSTIASDNKDLHKWLRELANALEKDLASQLRLQEKVRHQLTLAHRNRTETNFDDELAAKFDKKKKSFQSACFPRLSKGQARGEIVSKSSLLGSFISEMHFHIRSLDPMSFHIRSFDNSSLSTKALDSTNFQDDSLTEETFRQATSQPAAWQKRPSDRQLLRQQLGRRDLHTGNFRDSSLEDETFSTAASKKAAWKRHFALATSKKAASKRAAWKTAAFKEEQLQLSLQSFERPALKTAASKSSKTAASKTAAWKRQP